MAGLAIAINTGISSLVPIIAGRMYDTGFGLLHCVLCDRRVVHCRRRDARVDETPAARGSRRRYSDSTGRRVIREGDLLWTPDPARIERARITRFMRWLGRERGISSTITRHSGDGPSGTSRGSGAHSGITSRSARACRPNVRSADARCRARNGSPARGSTTRRTCSATRAADAKLCSTLSERQPPTSLSWDELARARARLANALRGLGSSRATASSAACRTRLTPSSRCSRRPASVRSGRVAGLTSARAACSTVSRSSRPRCSSASTGTSTAASRSTAAPTCESIVAG